MSEIKLPLDLIIGYSSANDVSPYVLDAEGQPVDIADLNAHIAGLEETVSEMRDDMEALHASGADEVDRAEQAERERDEAVGMVRKLADRVDAAVEFIEDALEEGIEQGETRMRVEASTAVVWLSSMPSAQDDVKAARALLAKLTGGGDV